MVVLVHERDVEPTRYERFRSILAAPWRVVRREKHVRRFLIANTAWEATFAGMRTFVVLYIIDGLDQPLYVSSTVLGVVAAGYVLAALAAGRFGDEFGVGNVILGASVVYGLGLLVAGFAQTVALVVLRADRAGGDGGRRRDDARLGPPLQGHAGDRPWDDHGPRDDHEGARARSSGPLAAGAAIDIFHSHFRSTDGYAVIWPVVAIPVLGGHPARRSPRGGRGHPQRQGDASGRVSPKPHTLSLKT